MKEPEKRAKKTSVRRRGFCPHPQSLSSGRGTSKPDAYTAPPSPQGAGGGEDEGAVSGIEFTLKNIGAVR